MIGWTEETVEEAIEALPRRTYRSDDAGAGAESTAT